MSVSRPTSEETWECFQDTLMRLAGTEGCMAVVKMKSLIPALTAIRDDDEDPYSKAAELLKTIYDFNQILVKLEGMK